MQGGTPGPSGTTTTTMLLLVLVLVLVLVLLLLLIIFFLLLSCCSGHLYARTHGTHGTTAQWLLNDDIGLALRSPNTCLSSGFSVGDRQQQLLDIPLRSCS